MDNEWTASTGFKALKDLVDHFRRDRPSASLSAILTQIGNELARAMQREPYSLSYVRNLYYGTVLGSPAPEVTTYLIALASKRIDGQELPLFMLTAKRSKVIHAPQIDVEGGYFAGKVIFCAKCGLKLLRDHPRRKFCPDCARSKPPATI